MAFELKFNKEKQEESSRPAGCQGCQNLQKAKPDKKRKPRSSNKKFKDRAIAVASILLIIVAWFIGSYRENTDIGPYLHQAIPEAERIEPSTNGNYAAYNKEQLIGYISIGVASGYGGPIRMAVATDIEGLITNIIVVRHLETPSFFYKVDKNGLILRLMGKSYNDAFNLDVDVDGVSGATYTSQGIANAVLNASQRIAKTELNIAVAPRAPAKVEFGVPEITLVALFLLGTLGRKISGTHTKKLRWFSMLTGMVVLGFIYTNPMTISLFNKMLLGFWPDWHTHLYWYILIFGIVFSLTVLDKNAYCEWICPFGAVQECMGKIGGAKAHPIRRFQSQLKWLQRAVALTAIVIALIYRNPGISSYEVFGTLFSFEGNIPQFFLLGLVLVVSTLIHRPWCRYLCPLHPIESFIKLINTWRKDVWLKVRPVKKIQN